VAQGKNCTNDDRVISVRKKVVATTSRDDKLMGKYNQSHNKYAALTINDNSNNIESRFKISNAKSVQQLAPH